MKQDLTTSVFTAIVGVIIAYFVCNMILPPIQDFSYKTITSELTYNIEDPNPEIFNFRAVNPTVEVYVGQCDSYDRYGNCSTTTIEDIIDPNQIQNILEDEELTNDSDKVQNNTNGGNSNGTTD